MTRSLNSVLYFQTALEEAADAASLNAGQDLSELGYELDEVSSKFLDSDIVKNEADALALEDRIEDLLSLMRVINEKKAINKTIALEAERIIPGFIKTNIDHYTDEPTKTMYNLATEELSKTVKTFLVAIAVAVIGLIYKLIKWIFGNNNTSSGGNSNSSGSSSSHLPSKVNLSNGDYKQAEEIVEKMEEQLDNQVEVVAEQAELVENFQDYLAGCDFRLATTKHKSAMPLKEDGSVDRDKLIRIRNLDELIEYAIQYPDMIRSNRRKYYLESMNPTALAYDFITHGDFSKYLLSVIRYLPTYVSHLSSQADVLLEAYDKISDYDITYNDMSYNNVHIASMRKLKDSREALRKINIAGRESNISDVITNILNEQKKLSEEHTRTKQSFVKMSATFHDNINIPELREGLPKCKHLIHICNEKIAPTMDNIHAAFRSTPEIAGLNGTVPERAFEMYSELCRGIIQDLNAVSALINVMKSILTIREDIMKRHDILLGSMSEFLYIGNYEAGGKDEDATHFVKVHAGSNANMINGINKLKKRNRFMF